MHRHIQRRAFVFFATLAALTVAYAKLTLAEDHPVPQAVTRPAPLRIVDVLNRIPAPVTSRPVRSQRITSSSHTKADTRFQDVDLRLGILPPGPLRAAGKGELQPARPAPNGVRSPDRPSRNPDLARGLAGRVDARGAPWSADRLLADATHMDDAYVSLARSPVSGDLYAVFEATDLGGTDRDIHIARSDDDGLTWSVLEMPSFSQDESMPDIAIDAAGFLHVVWIRADGYIVRTRSSFADDPTSWAWIKGLFTDSINATPSVAVTGAGDFATLFVAASYQEINYDLMSWEWTLIWMWSTNAGNTISFDALVPDGFPDYWPGVAMNGARVHLINGEADAYGGPVKILLASDSISGGFSEVTDLTAWTGFNTGFPDVA